MYLVLSCRPSLWASALSQSTVLRSRCFTLLFLQGEMCYEVGYFDTSRPAMGLD